MQIMTSFFFNSLSEYIERLIHVALNLAFSVCTSGRFLPLQKLACEDVPGSLPRGFTLPVANGDIIIIISE